VPNLSIEILITILLFGFAHIGSLIWFLSSMRTDIRNIKKTVERLEEENSRFVTREELREKLEILKRRRSA